ncbi:hypothetical protein Tco_0520626 [Tanacetum coccineum]
MESLNSNSQERELHQLQQMQHKAKESCMKSFRLLQSHLQVLSYNDLKINGCFERAFTTLFEQDVQTFTGSMLLHLDQLEKQLGKEEFQEIGSMDAFKALKRQFQLLISFQYNFDYFDDLMIRKYFLAYTRTEVQQFRNTLIQHMESVKKSIVEREKHKQVYDSRMNDRKMQPKEKKKLQTQEVQSNTVHELKVDSVVMENTCSRKENGTSETASSKTVKESSFDSATKDVHAIKYKMSKAKEICMTHEGKVDSSEDLDVSLIVTECSGTKSDEHITRSSSGTYITHVVDADIRPVDSNTTPDSTNMCHRRGEIDQDAEQYQAKSPLLKVDFLKMNDMVEKEVYNELSNRFLQLEKHCISLEISMQQKEEITPHYLPKVREYVLAKPHHVIAPGSSRNSQEEPYGSNDMAHNHYLEEAKKKTQKRNRNSKPSVMHTTSLPNTTNGSKPNPRSNNQILLVSKSSCGMSNGVSLVDNSRNSSSFSDSKHFVCSTCHKCIFNANHDNFITKFLKEVNSLAKVQSPKTRNNNKLVEPKSHTQKPSRQITIGQRFSLNKSSAVHEKPNTPRSCLRWIPTSRIFKLVGLRWIPTGKMFIDSITKVDSEPPNGSNEDITKPYECNQTLNVSAGIPNLSAVQASLFNDKMAFVHISSSLALQRKMASVDNTSDPVPQRKERSPAHISLGLGHHLMTPGTISSELVPQPPFPTPNVPPIKNDWDSLFCPMFDE